MIVTNIFVLYLYSRRDGGNTKVKNLKQEVPKSLLRIMDFCDNPDMKVPKWVHIRWSDSENNFIILFLMYHCCFLCLNFVYGKSPVILILVDSKNMMTTNGKSIIVIIVYSKNMMITKFTMIWNYDKCSFFHCSEIYSKAIIRWIPWVAA